MKSFVRTEEGVLEIVLTASGADREAVIFRRDVKLKPALALYDGSIGPVFSEYLELETAIILGRAWVEGA